MEKLQGLRKHLKDFDAAMLGIDLAKLEEERFGSDAHWILMTEHYARVDKYRAQVQWQQFEGFLNEVGQMWREKEKHRRARIAATKQGKEYDFPDEILQIAIRSLDAGGSM